MNGKTYSLLVSTIGLPWGYRGAVYTIEGSKIPAVYTSTALTKRYNIKKAIIVGLDAVAFPEKYEDIMLIDKRIKELKKAKESPIQSLFSFFRERSEAEGYQEVLRMELSAKEKFLREKPGDVYSFFLSQDGFKLNVESYSIIKVNISNIAAEVAKEALKALSDVNDREINVILDITHGLNWLPLQTEKGLELGLKLASFVYSKKINLQVFLSKSIKKVTSDPMEPERGEIEKVFERSFYMDDSLREITWSLMNSMDKLPNVAILAFFFEISAPLAVAKYVNENWDKISSDFAQLKDELSVSAKYYSEWLRSETKGLWVPGKGMSLNNMEYFMNKAVKTVYPIGEELLKDELKILNNIQNNVQKKY